MTGAGVKRWLKLLPPPAVDRLIAAHRGWKDFKFELSDLATRFRPGSDPPWPGYGLPFNGQELRQRVVHYLISSYSPDAFLETGTYMGDTARFFLGYGRPLYTVESKRLFWAAARIRLSSQRDLHLVRGDSLVGIERLRRGGCNRPLAYLDAHWWGVPPLADEVHQLITGWAEVVIVIDDCRVPNDEGYGFDSYKGTPLGISMLELDEGVIAAYPAQNSRVETGARRGTLYLAKGGAGMAAVRGAIGLGMLTEVERQSAAAAR